MAKSIIIVEQIHAILHSSLFILLTSKKQQQKNKIKKILLNFYLIVPQLASFLSSFL